MDDEFAKVHKQRWNAFQESSGNATTFSEWIYLTQCLQTLCIGAESEHYRRLKGDKAQTMGAIYWQLNDIWQAPTWSSTEFGGRWKMLHYSARRFFSPVLVSAYEDPLDSLHIYVTSDLTVPLSNGSLVLSVWKWSGQKIYSSVVSSGLNLDAFQSKQVFETSISSFLSPLHTNRSSVVFTFEWTSQTSSLSPSLHSIASDPKMRLSSSFSLLRSSSSYSISASNVFYLSSFAEADLIKPIFAINTISMSSGTQGPVVKFNVTSTQVAPFVFLESPLSGRFSDNGMLLLKDVPITLDFIGWQSFSLAEFEDTLEIKSIASLSF